ncbi:PREDICTED: uncharacterized protein K02A2.6-like [Rhagoletis zephyria]|uniref:uncharacterized protein K02A2.6-like n=1 Tax=Rhagoletis zephyria TaxID=28612 RepID=UPI00081132A5|nr:PREDICTED: uncharacterized protein K02A2.6-like [Rhagoletis zephyria]
MRPIAYVSRALNNTALNYSTIEKEALAIIFSVIRLKQYLLGMHFVLQTDHRPLLAIFGDRKGIPIMAAARMQRWAFILTGFNYTIEYIKGSLNSADSLSRIGQIENPDTKPESTYINYVNFVNPLQLDFLAIAKYTRRDAILSKVANSILNGTLLNLGGNEFNAFKTKASELTVESGCILWGYRTVIPSKLQGNVLQELHKSHLGIVKTKSLARSYVYWPNIDKDIENMIKTCEPCQKYQANPEKSFLIPWEPTYSAWKRIHVDFAGPVHGYYLFLIIDSFSKWPEVFKTKVITATFTINKLREVFSRFGLCDVLVSDNGRQFTSLEFQAFAKANGIKLSRTAPGHPSTNGQAENFVKTIKKSLIATLEQNEVHNFDVILQRFLFDYRITKHCTTNESPSKLLLNRELKSRFSLMQPPTTKDIIESKQINAVKNYKGKRKVNFSVGQNVYVRDYKNPNKAVWSPAVIQKKLGPRNYTCYLTRDKRDIKRHLDQIINRSDVNTETLSEEPFEETNIPSEARAVVKFEEPLVEIDDLSEEDDVFKDASDSIPYNIERRETRQTAARARVKITEQIAPQRLNKNDNRNN